MSTGADKTRPQMNENGADADRRKFLASCGRFAAVTPPAITFLLSTSLNSEAVAASGGIGNHSDRGGERTGHHRDGNGGRDHGGRPREPFKRPNGLFPD